MKLFFHSLRGTRLLAHALLAFCLAHVTVTGAAAAEARIQNFKSILTAALANAHAPRIAEVDVEISRERLLKARAEYYPSISVGFANERVHDLDAGEKGIVSVGGSVINSSATTWQHSLSVNADYTLYDFGARGEALANADRNIAIAEMERTRKTMELKLQVLDLYSKALHLSKRLQSQATVLEGRRDLYAMLSRLRDAGVIEELELASGAIEAAEALKECGELRQAVGSVLTEFTALTGVAYSSEETRFADFEETGASPIPAINAASLPEIRAYDLEIRNKEGQRRMMQTKFLPRLRLYSSYRLYGADSASFQGSLAGLGEKNFTAGVVAEMNLFDGFRDKADASIVRLEERRLKLERQKALAAHQQRIDSLRHAAAALRDRADLRRTMAAEIEREAAMVDRLDEERLRGRIILLRRNIALEEKRLEIDLEETTGKATLLRLRIMNEAQSKPWRNM